MHDLRKTMANNGFESNDDYELQTRCLLQGKGPAIRTLSIEGDSERRKTAFATALAYSLDYAHVLYHDFSDEPPVPEVILPPSKDEYGREELPVDALDDIASKACALSEAEKVILILDQLHSANFREHIRIHRLIRDRQWLVHDAPYYANGTNLLLFLISEEPLYHALQRESFRVWVSRVSQRRIDYRPAQFGLASDAALLFGALTDLCRALGAAPTPTEFEHLLHDLIQHVQTEEHLRHVLFGRIEGIDRERLYAEETRAPLSHVIDELRAYLGAEQIVLSAD